MVYNMENCSIEFIIWSCSIEYIDLELLFLISIRKIYDLILICMLCLMMFDGKINAADF